MGPCRIDPFGEGASAAFVAPMRIRSPRAICSATLPQALSAHSDHGRVVAHTLIFTAREPSSPYRIADPAKLLRLAEEGGIKTEGRELSAIAEEVGRLFLEAFGRPEREVFFIRRAPAQRQQRWREQDVVPRAIDREVVQARLQTRMGVEPIM